jgi:hypothetical protein
MVIYKSVASIYYSIDYALFNIFLPRFAAGCFLLLLCFSYSHSAQFIVFSSNIKCTFYTESINLFEFLNLNSNKWTYYFFYKYSYESVGGGQLAFCLNTETPGPGRA